MKEFDLAKVVDRRLCPTIKTRFRKWQLKRKTAKEEKRLRKLYPDYCENEFDAGSLKFIWGVMDTDNIIHQSYQYPCALTMNDIEIFYDREAKEYTLGLETAYGFIDGKHGEIKHLEHLLDCFKEYMQQNNFDTEYEYRFFLSKPYNLFKAETIPELYTSFRIFVEGYKALYREHEKTPTPPEEAIENK